MKKGQLLLLLLFFVVISAANTQVIFVQQGATGNGTSWENATGDLRAVLLKAKPGNQVWVAKGKYTPTTTNNRTLSFNIPDGVEVYGGFAGYESSINQRNLVTNETILSGDIGSPYSDDNSYSVVLTEGVSSATIIDGLTISNGVSNGLSKPVNKDRSGAGWFNDGTSHESSPTINNCIFKNNSARDGAGLYNFATNGVCKPKLTNCQFISNKADLDGGAVYNDGRSGLCNPTFVNCVFENNEATYGGGMINQPKDGECSPILKNCIVTRNVSYIRGGAIYNVVSFRGICEPEVISCQITDNKASVGRDIYQTSNTSKVKMSAGLAK
ncbi:MAG: hypothetical protein GY705_29350 [Bacteroidetes bacterium]|nr:hypothetical protein [Bacteroidota bacterium]